METLPLNVPHYPMLRFIARYGRGLVLAISVLLFLAGVMMAIQTASATPGVIALLLAVVVYVVGRALVEMVQLISDMLLPK